MKKKEIGKGIKALLSSIDDDVTADEQKAEVVQELASAVATIPVDQIEVNPFQPRYEFDAEALQDLSNSIKIHGLIQPITVRRLAENQYQLISGERRLRASKMAGIQEIPCYVRLANDQEMLEMALVENIQREELNAVEIAITYQRLIDECALTHEDLSDRIGKKRSTVSNYLRLLKLPPQIQQAIKSKQISMGHARALAGIEDLGLQLDVFHNVIKNHLSVRATEGLASAGGSKRKPSSKQKQRNAYLPIEYMNIVDELRHHLGTKVSMKRANSGKGQIIIDFNSDDELNRLLEIIE